VVEKKEIAEEPTNGVGRERIVGHVKSPNPLDVGILPEKVDDAIEVLRLHGDVIVKKENEIHIAGETIDPNVPLTG